ncbi:MAG: type II toxin-antitoxin system HicB family antitoxin [Phycisphaerales bacterium]|nr:type II toxin-antitoxin system HicB family antitoxin [Phycisphaerales bacterium]
MDRPFEPRILERARAIVARYRIVLEPNDELGYIGSAVEMPNAYADGKTPEQCVAATREALTAAVATMIEMGKRPPVDRGQRSMQVNIRLTAHEKLILEDAAARRGFRGISDFLRTAALEKSESN